MEFGIHIGTRGCLTNRDNMMARRAGRRGEWLRHRRRTGSSGHAGGTRGHLSLHRHRPASRRRNPASVSTCLATLAFLAGCTKTIKLLTSVVVVPHRPRHFDRETVPDGGCAVRRPADRRCRRRLDEGRVRRSRHAAVRRTRRRHRRIYRGLESAVDPGPAVDARQIRRVRQRAVRAEAGAKAASADLGRRRKQPVAAPRRAARRWLVSGVEQQPGSR